MSLVLGHVAVSASFDPTAREGGKLRYVEEFERLREEDQAAHYQACAFALNPDAARDGEEFCRALESIGFPHRRGIIAGVDLCVAAHAAEAQAQLRRHLEYALELGLTKVMCVAQEWPAGDRDADFELDVVPPFVETVSVVLRELPELEEFGLEPLIPVEQQHVNTFARARLMAQRTNEVLGEQRVRPVPDLAHLYGLVPRDSWAPITEDLLAGIEAGEVSYAHLSIPESRTDRITVAIEDGALPMEAVRALRLVPFVDTEAFDPQDPFLDALRERVPRFLDADTSGWTEDRRFARFVEAARYFEGLV